MPPRKKVKTDHVHEGATTGTRRTTRASSKAANTVTAEASDVQPTVAASVAPAVFKLRRGCLKEIPNFAVEIQLMIFGNLHPQDLFNLSRTSKVFHGFFLHRSNEALWEAALENTEDLPERPPWLSIPAFIHLLYSTHCHNCGCPNIRKVVWPWFARYCSNCLPKVSSGPADVIRRFSEARCNTHVDYALHSIQAPTADKLQYNSYGYDYQSRRRRRGKWYLKRHVDEFLGQWSALPEPRGSDTTTAFQSQRYNDIKVQMKYAARCEQWHDRLEEDRKDDLRNGRTERFSAIIEKLKETGWEKDLVFLGPEGLEKMSRLPVVRQSAKLTDKGWEKVQEALHAFLTETRGSRLKEEHEVVVKLRFVELDKAIVAHCVTIPRDATMECHPVALDLALHADLEPVANAPSSETVTSETFAAIVPKLVANWDAEQRQFLRSFLGRFITKVPRGVDILDLAIAIVYTASSYREVRTMRYPYLLTRSIFRQYGLHDCDRGDFPSSHYAYPVCDGSYSGPFNFKSLEPKPVEVGIKWMRNIVTKLGLNPGAATFTDLEQCEARLHCLKCAELGRQQSAYTWEAAFAHTAQNNTTHSHDAYPRSSHSRWSRVDKVNMEKVKEREAIAHALTVDSDCWWSCALCVDWQGWGGEGDVRKHLASEHNITDANGAIEDGRIFWSPLHNDKLRKPAVQL